MKTRLRRMLALIFLVLVPLATGAQQLPVLGDLEQRNAEPVLASAPASAACTVTLMQDKQFRNTAYPPANPDEPDRNFSGSYAPPAGCPGPWSKIVLDVGSRISGTQFDRLLDVYVGDVLLLSSSTSEPCCTGRADQFVHWTAQRDVTAYAALLARPGSVHIDLGNVVDSTYTGIYLTSATLSFYPAAAATPAPPTPQQVIGVHGTTDSQQADGYFQVSKVGAIATQSVSFPRNLLRVEAELFAQGHGACEEFWWGQPGQCGNGTPFREVAVYLDGQLAGAAPVYPVTFTGANGPGFWEPIPAPRAWNLKPYRVDLTPFVGTLVDGKPHTLGLAALDAVYGDGDVWDLAANLLLWTDPHAARTRGALTLATAPAAATHAPTADPSGQGLFYLDHFSYALDFGGWVKGSAGRVTTQVHEEMSGDSTQGPAGAAVQTSWDWLSRRTTTRGTSTTVGEAHETYGITFTLLTHFGLAESRTTTLATDGARSAWTSYDRSMNTTDASGIAWNGVSSDEYRYADSAGACVDHILGAGSGLVILDTDAGNCPTQPP
jgi:hypothetical protein